MKSESVSRAEVPALRQNRLASVSFTVAAVTVVAALGLVEADLAASGQVARTTLPAGSVLYLRLEGAVSTKTSHLREAVTARVVREVPASLNDTEIAIPVGAVVRGLVEKLVPSSSPAD